MTVDRCVSLTFLKRMLILLRKIPSYFTYAEEFDLRRFVRTNVTVSALGPGNAALICRRTERVIRGVNGGAAGLQGMGQGGTAVIR